MKTGQSSPQRAGRPRSEASRLAILSAAMRLLDETSLRDLTIEAIAREAGVGKVTIYRWWPSKTHVVIDAFMELMTPLTSMPKPGARLSHLTRHFAAVVKDYQGKFGRVVAEIIAEGQFDRDALQYFLEAMIAKRRDFAVGVVESAKQAGEIRADIDTDILIDLLYGPLYFRLLVGHAPLDARLGKDLIRAFGQLVEKIPAPNRARQTRRNR